MRTDILERSKEIKSWIQQNQSKAFICRQLKCKPETLNSYLKTLQIDYSGNIGGKGIKKDPRRLKAIEFAKCHWVSSDKLKKRLLEDGIKNHQCEMCNRKKWMKKPIPLELDHIDGNHYNNDLSNLRVLCPNCHATTDTNSGKNVGRYSGPIAQLV